MLQSSGPPAPPAKSSEALRSELQSVHSQLRSMKRQWDEEKRKLLGDQAVLKDAANRLNMEVQDTRERMAERERAGEKAKAGTQEELGQAKKVISDLEEELKTERARLRTLNTEQGRWDREKQDILLQLRRTESVRLLFSSSASVDIRLLLTLI